MTPSSDVFEKLGLFYLGTSTESPAEPALLDSRDLVTHAVCLGMTGSGKTGLCLALLEEAAIDGVPAIIIDPKGDLANLLLTFPDLRTEDFLPWVPEEEARREGIPVGELAARHADRWRRGLEQSGQSGERIRQLRAKTDFRLYTPGSTAGHPVNLAAAFRCPGNQEDSEIFLAAVQSATDSLLGLLGRAELPPTARESAFLSAVIQQSRTRGEDLDLPALVEKIQRPGFDRIGVMDLETFYPAKDRFALVMELNALLASPGFAVWMQGEPLDVDRFLAAPDGRPRHAIFSIAHLDDTMRMFFVSTLLNAVVGWTRRQSGTSSLRALVYLDEIMGYLPPVANPPSKWPLLTLLKQARAFGVGVTLATQNPVDLDYKALANIGTWLVGRLQSERDKSRVLEGILAASSAVDRTALDAALSALQSRQFLLAGAHRPEPEIFQSRWAMSYLRGPLTREEIRRLREADLTDLADTVDDENAESPDAVPGTAAPPVLPPGISQFFAPASGTLVPRLLGVADVRFSPARRGASPRRRRIAFSATLPTGAGAPDWSGSEPWDGTPEELLTSPGADSQFGELPPSGYQAANYTRWEKAFRSWLADHATEPVFHEPASGEMSQPGESLESFTQRVRFAVREQRDASVAKLRQKYTSRLDSLTERIARARLTVETQRQQATHAKVQSAVSIGSAILGAFLGRSSLSRAGTAARGVSRAMKEGGDVAAAEANLVRWEAERVALEQELESEIAALTTAAAEPAVETLHLTPVRSGVEIVCFGLCWM